VSTEQIFALGRVIERLLICTIGGVSLVLGWNLFRVGVVTQQAAELSAKGWRLNLKRVGPGVFFAVFGAVVLSLSLRSPLNLPLRRFGDDLGQGTGRDEKKDLSTVVYGHGDDPEVAKRWVASINTSSKSSLKRSFQVQRNSRLLKGQKRAWDNFETCY
jgi:hypothetical protein